MAITMDNNNRAFTGMWIPAAIWLHEDLNITEKCLIAEIVSLNNNAGGCFASNAHFSKFLNLSKNRVSAILSSLQDRGWITLINERRNNQIIKRQIFIAFNYGPTGLPTPKDKDNDANTDDEPNEEGTPEMEEGIPNMEEGIPSADKPLPYSEGGIPNIRKVNSHLNNHLNNQLNNHNNNQVDVADDYNALQDFEKLWMFPNEIQREMLYEMIDNNGNELVSAAIKLAGANDVIKGRAINFLKAVLKEWSDNNITNKEQAEAYQDKRNQQYKKPYSKSTGRNESVPNWFNEENKGEEIDHEKDAEFAERRRKIRARKNHA